MPASEGSEQPTSQIAPLGSTSSVTACLPPPQHLHHLSLLEDSDYAHQSKAQRTIRSAHGVQVNVHRAWPPTGMSCDGVLISLPQCESPIGCCYPGCKEPIV